MILKWLLPYRDIGWTEIGEEFTRFTFFTCRWLTIYIHRLYAPNPHPDCHDHPWSFVTFILKGGYWETTNGQDWCWRRPGSILYRPAEFSHNVVTRDVAWSVVITGPKKREWGFNVCH